MHRNQQGLNKKHQNLNTYVHRCVRIAIQCVAFGVTFGASNIAVAATTSPIASVSSQKNPKTPMKTIELELRLTESRLNPDTSQVILEPETWIQKSSYDRYIFDAALWQQLKIQLKSQSSVRVRLSVSALPSQQYQPPAGTIAATPQGGFRIVWWKVHQFKLLK